MDPTPCSDVEGLQERLRREVGMGDGLIQALFEHVDPRLIRDALEKLPAWKAYDLVRPLQERIRSWAAWLYKCLIRGPLAAVQKTAQEYWQRFTGGSPPPMPSEGSCLPRLNSSPVARSKRPSSWTPPAQDGGRKIAAGQAQQELAEEEKLAQLHQAELENNFEVLQRILSDEELEQALEQARKEAGPWLPEKDDAFKGILRAITVERFGSRLQSALPLKLGRRKPDWNRHAERAAESGCG